jgi:hypothetical protein
MLNLNNIRRGYHPRSGNVYGGGPTDKELNDRGRFRVGPDEIRFIQEVPTRKARETIERPPTVSPAGEFMEGIVGE